MILSLQCKAFSHIYLNYTFLSKAGVFRPIIRLAFLNQPVYQAYRNNSHKRTPVFFLFFKCCGENNVLKPKTQECAILRVGSLDIKVQSVHLQIWFTLVFNFVHSIMYSRFVTSFSPLLSTKKRLRARSAVMTYLSLSDKYIGVQGVGGYGPSPPPFFC